MNEQIKKYCFFKEIENISKLTSNEISYNLSELNVIDLKFENKFNYLLCKVKKKNNLESIILKLRHFKIIKEFNSIYNRNILFFIPITIFFKTFIITLGSDFKEIIFGNDKTFLNISSVKIFSSDDYNQENIKTIKLLKYIDKNEIYIKNNFIKSIEPINDFLCFDISKDGEYIGIGLEKGEIILIHNALINVNLENNDIFYLMKCTNDNITNIKFSKNLQNEIIIYVTTINNIFYYYKKEGKFNFKKLNIEHGCLNKCFNINEENNKLLICSPIDNSISEIVNFEKGGCWLFEGKKNFVGYFKNNLVFIQNNNKEIKIYDNDNRIYIYSNQINNNNELKNETISSIFIDKIKNNIYLIKEEKDENDNEKINKKLITLREILPEKKLEYFYLNNDYILALNYIKKNPAEFSDKDLSEINKKFGDFYYNQGDFNNSVNQYIDTINNINPINILDKFLDSSKMDYLIKYLEKINSNNLHTNNISSTNKNYYLKLLLNCYIKQKQYKKMQEFIEKISSNQEKSTIIRYTIDICKETNQIDLAINLINRTNNEVNDVKIEVYIEMKKDFNEALNLLLKEKNLLIQVNSLIKYENILLNYNKEKTLKLIYQILNHLINLKNKKEVIVGGNEDYKKNVNKLKYEDLLDSLSEYEDIYEKILDFIIFNDKDFSKEIIHRKFVILMKKYLENKEKIYSDELVNLIKNTNIQNKIDQNYILTIFKTNNFKEGIIALCEILNLHNELMAYYMESKNYDNLLKICDNYSYMNKNILVQNLNYFIDQYKINKNTLNYIEILLAKISEMNLITPILLLEISKKMEGILKFNVLKKYINIILKEQINITENCSKEKEENFNKLFYITIQNKELKKIKILKLKNICDYCEKKINYKNKEDIICYCCKHTYHRMCLITLYKDKFEGDDICPKCLNKNNQLAQRMKQSDEQIKDHNNFFIDLNQKQKKFELIIKYLGKGLFKFKNK